MNNSKDVPARTEIRELKPEEITIPVDLTGMDGDDQDNQNRWGLIGQPRARQALEMGIKIKAPGYNLFVTGDPGTGRFTAIKGILKQNNQKSEPLLDIAYVYNFKNPESPRVLYFEEGKASAFKKDLHQLIERFKVTIKDELSSDSFKKRRDSLITSTDKEENRTLAEFEMELSREHFQTVQIEDEDENTSTDLLPVYEGKAVEFEELQGLVASGKITEEFWHETREKYFHYMDEMNRIFTSLRISREALDNKLNELQKEAVSPLISREIEGMKKDYSDKKILTWLDDLSTDITEHCYLFKSDQDTDEDESPESPFLRYGINIIVDNTNTKEIPVVRETNPLKSNIFGAIETRFDSVGNGRTNFMMIKAGSMLKANGGFLILRAQDIFTNEERWTELKRAIQTESVELEIQASPLGLPSTILKPEPVKIQVKVIIMGPSNLYEALSLQDDNFQKMFKISAEFNSVMKFNDDTLREYVHFIRSFIRKVNLKSITDEGIREICRYSARLADRRDLLSTRFSLIADLIRESDYWATKAQRAQISGKDVQEALKAKQFMFNLPEEMQYDSIQKNYITIETDGKRIGGINGLAVLERGFYAFGTPMRISAIAGAGKDGILNIDREVGLSGEIHSKGVMILEGFLRQRFARYTSLSIHGSICIEQSYSEIEGDSASSAELYVLLSAIAQIPLRQDIAVTGSVNQFGMIQPVGGVTEKVEAFFKICESRGLTGKQGVMIPMRNCDNLLPCKEVVDAVEKGLFHIYPINSIDEGLNILTGMETGEQTPSGKYPQGTLNHKIQKELLALSKVKD